MAVPAQPMPPATKAMHQQESPTTSPRVYTPNATPEATPPPPMRVDPPGQIIIMTGQAARPTPYIKPHVIQYNMDTMPNSAHQNTREQPTVPQIYRYSTRA